MSRGCRHFTNGAGSESDNQDCDHNIRRAVAFRSVVEDLDEWESSRGLQNLGGITKTETQSHDHDETKYGIQDHSPRDGSGERFGGVLDLFGY